MGRRRPVLAYRTPVATHTPSALNATLAEEDQMSEYLRQHGTRRTSQREPIRPDQVENSAGRV
jgi:hypothetical protein